VDALLILHRIAQKGWVDARIIAPTLQRTVEEAAAALQRFSRVALEGSAVIRPVAGVQDSSANAYCLKRLLKKGRDHWDGVLRDPDALRAGAPGQGGSLKAIGHPAEPGRHR